MTQEEEALGAFTRLKLKTLVIQPEWQADESVQLDRFEALCAYGTPVRRPDNPNPVILCPHWKYKVKSDGKLRSRNCCDGSPRAVLALHGTASTYSSCVEQPIQRLFFVLSAQLGVGVYKSDATDAYAHSPPPDVPTLMAIDEAHADWFQVRHGILPQLYREVGPTEGLPKSTAIAKERVVGYRTLLGELPSAYISYQPDIGYAVVTLSKFAATPSKIHYTLLKNVAKSLRCTIDWGITYTKTVPRTCPSRVPETQQSQPACLFC